MRAVIRRKNRLVLDDIAPTPLGEGLVRCRTLACGICGSDLHAIDHMDKLMRMAPDAMRGDPNADIVFGHEFCCEVLESGPATTGRLKPGTRVASMPVALTPAGVETIGYSPRLPGGFAEEMLLMEAMLLEVPNGLSAEHAALTEPLAVGDHAAALATPDENSVHLVIGCDPVGLAVIASLKARGAGPVIATDFSARRRALAERMGADRVVDPAQASPHACWAEYAVPATGAEAMMAQMTGQTPKKPVVFECVGAPGMLQRLAEEAPPGARIVVVGVCMETDAIEPLHFIAKQIELRFALGYSPAEFAACLGRLANGETNYPEIVTSVVGLAATPDALVRETQDRQERSENHGRAGPVIAPLLGSSSDSVRRAIATVQLSARLAPPIACEARMRSTRSSSLKSSRA